MIMNFSPNVDIFSDDNIKLWIRVIIEEDNLLYSYADKINNNILLATGQERTKLTNDIKKIAAKAKKCHHDYWSSDINILSTKTELKMYFAAIKIYSTLES